MNSLSSFYRRPGSLSRCTTKEVLQIVVRASLMRLCQPESIFVCVAGNASALARFFKRTCVTVVCSKAINKLHSLYAMPTNAILRGILEFVCVAISIKD